MPDFLLSPQIAFVALVLASIADVVTTLRGLDRGAREANPVVAWMMEHLGGKGWIVAKMAGTLASGAAILVAGQAWVLWLLTALTVGVAIHNYREVE